MSANYVDYDNATEIITAIGQKLDGKYTTISYSDWLNLTDQEKESGKYYITGAPGADGSIQVDLITKLWENPDPTAEFAEQTITLSSDDWDLILVIAYASASDTKVVSTVSPNNGYISLGTAYSSGAAGRSRGFSLTNKTHITFDNAYCAAGTTPASSINTALIPYQIYGIKTTQTIHLNAIASDVSTSADQCMMSDGVTSVEDELAILLTIADKTYTGTDLTIKFADEIVNYSDEWAWIQARLDAHDMSGLHIGDYIPINIAANGGIAAETHKAEIAGINTYRRTGDNGHEVGYHIDWITRDCYSGTVQFNTSNNNNGNASNSSPFPASNLKSWLDGTLYGLLDAKLKAVIKAKRILAPYRYQSGATLTDDNSWGWQDFDKLWVPLEGEIFDSLVWSTKGFGNGQAVQYPIFANSYEHRMKGAGPGGARAYWWTASAYSGASTIVVYVGGHGTSANYYASSAFCVPVCFRTMEA